MNKLTKISFVISLFGILILLLLSNIIQSPIISISEIGSQHINKQITIKADIINIKNYENFQVLILEDYTGNISAIINSNKLKRINNTIITGKVQEYKDNLQININKISK